MTPSSRGLGHRPFTAVTGVRIPLGSPNYAYEIVTVVKGGHMHNRSRYFYLVFALTLAACSSLGFGKKEFYCDAGDVTSIGGIKQCCRGYRADSENWSGFNGRKCCPEGTSVNGNGECVACGANQYYNMGYADLQNKRNGIQACGQRCTKNEDCPSDRFCYMDAHATGSVSQITPIVGTCVTPQDVGGIVASEVVVYGQSAGYWIGPKNYMDWWSARNFCLRYGKVDLPTREQICGKSLEHGQACPSPLRIALEETIGVQQQAPHFWLEATDSGKAYYVDPKSWGYVVKIPPEITARTRSAGVVCGPVEKSNLPSDALISNIK